MVMRPAFVEGIVSHALSTIALPEMLIRTIGRMTATWSTTMAAVEENPKFMGVRGR